MRKFQATLSELFLWSLLPTVILAENITQHSGFSSEERRLLHHLLSAYHSQQGSVFARPVHSVTSTVRVNLDLALIEMTFDEKRKTLNLSVWTKYIWRDEFLRWDPSDYGGVDKLRIDPNSIWMPDIQLYNTGSVQKSRRDTYATVKYNGHVIYYTLVLYSVSCALDLTNFPFDRQKCQLLMGSWLYNTTELDIGIRGGVDLSNWGEDFKEASAWTIVNTSAKTLYEPSNSTLHVTVIQYELILDRKVVFSTYILTLPCIFLSCLTVAVFWLPPHRPDRTSLAMNTFGSFMVLLLILVEAAPPTTATVPLLGVYYCLNIVSIVLAIILSTVVVNFSKGSNRPLPACIQKVIYSRGGRILMLHDAPSKSPAKSNGQVPRSEKTQLTLLDLSESETELCEIREQLHTADINPQQLRRIAEELKSHRVKLKEIVGHFMPKMQHTPSRANWKKDWELFGVLLDRIFGLMYIAFAIIIFVCFFPRPL